MKGTIKWISIFLLFCSLVLALYPTISRLITQNNCDKAAAEFDELVNRIQEGEYEDALNEGLVDENGKLTEGDNLPVLFKEDIERLYKDSLEYNSRLQEGQNIYHTSDFEIATLDLGSYGISNGMYGYLYADSIELTLPIYLGATEQNMRVGAAHLSMTSLPVGGTDTNTVLAGHTGYTGKTFFDNIRKLKEGDKIVIKNYFGSLTYTVSIMKNIESTDIDDIYIQEGKDVLTLMTCSNGGATRLLVICERSNTQ